MLKVQVFSLVIVAPGAKPFLIRRNFLHSVSTLCPSGFSCYAAANSAIRQLVVAQTCCVLQRLHSTVGYLSCRQPMMSHN